MSEGFSFEAVLAFLRRNIFLSGLTITGLALLVFGFFGTSFVQPPEESVVYEATHQADVVDNDTVKDDRQSTIMVDVSGAVLKPGVYELPSNSRVQDALSAAGGLADKADHQGIAKTMNLASKVADGLKLYFPYQGETSVLGVSNATSTIDSVSGNSGSTTSSGGLININLDSQSDLEELPGIGEVTALKIIKGRPYGSISDLKTKKIVGESVYGKIEKLITVN